MGYSKSLYYSSIGYNVSSYNTLYGTEYYADNIPTDFGKFDYLKNLFQKKGLTSLRN